MGGDRRRGRGALPRPRAGAARSGRGRAGAAAVALAALAALTGCGAVERAGTGPASATGGTAEADGPDPAAPGAASTRAAACEDVRSTLPCAAVTVDGTEYRYAAVRRPETSAGARAALVDLGGPGRALFASGDLLAFAAAWPGDETLLLLEEPWVRREVDPRCTEALAGSYRALHGAADGGPADGGAARALADRCDLAEPGAWGWTPESYRAVAAAAAEAEGLDLVGVVGTSFGASRVAGLWDLPGLEWVVLNSPSPRRATAAGYLAARADGALADLVGRCPGCDDPAAVAAAVEDWARRWDAAPVELATRTPLVDGTDVLAAVLATPYLPADGLAAAAAAVSGPPTAGAMPGGAPGAPAPAGAAGPAPTAAELVGTLSDSLLLRYGSEDVSPALLAYLQEVCREYGPWPSSAPAAGPAHTPAELLARLHLACGHVPPAPTRTAPLPAGPDAPRVCLARSADDRVTPAAFAATWEAELGAVERVTAPGRTHADPALAAACSRRLAGAG